MSEKKKKNRIDYLGQNEMIHYACDWTPEEERDNGAE